MGAPDKKTVIRELIEQGKAKGQLSTTEILDAIGELDFEPDPGGPGRGDCGEQH